MILVSLLLKSPYKL